MSAPGQFEGQPQDPYRPPPEAVPPPYGQVPPPYGPQGYGPLSGPPVYEQPSAHMPYGPVGPHAAYGVPPWMLAPAVKHRPWSTFLVVLLSLGTAIGGLVMIGGLTRGAFNEGMTAQIVGVGVDELSRSDIDRAAPLIVGVGVVTFAVAVTLLILTVVGRRQADRGRVGLLRGAAIAFLVLAILSAINALVHITSGGFGGLAVAVVEVSVCIKLIAVTGRS
jgi:hypothetical protein